MSTKLRRDPFNRNWVIIAPKRQERPNDFHGIEEDEQPCPFCEGNEHMTPPEVASIRQAEHQEPNTPGWTVRAFTNLFPALTPRQVDLGFEDQLYAEIPGIGGHEVIVQFPRHDLEPFEITEEAWEGIFCIFRQRYEYWAAQPDIRYVLIFQNYGRHSGASLMHPHNQLIATPVIPPRITDEIEGDREYSDKYDSCSYCEALARELEEEERIVFTTEHFVALCPYASRLPYETILLPRRHSQSFVDLSEDETSELAKAMKKLLTVYAKGLDNPPYNYLFHVKPVSATDDYSFFHWHLEFIPRLSTAAGFEWGSGIFINCVDPAEAAARLRKGVV